MHNRKGRLWGGGAVPAWACVQAWRTLSSCGALLAIVITLGCSSGGGGGDSGSMTRRPPSFFETTEYFANGGLEAIAAASPDSAGGTGDGNVSGVIDTRIHVDQHQ